MTRDDLITQLLALPERIEAQEEMLLADMSALADARAERALKEAILLLGPTIDGKNADARAAQLLRALADEDAEIRCREREVAHERVLLHRLENDFRSARALVALLASEGRDE